jgi:mutator protein MutT
MIDNWNPMKLKQATPKVGVGVFIFDEHERFLMGRRSGSHCDGQWALPGGHVELGETCAEAAAREVKEEIGLHIDPQNAVIITVVDDIFKKEGLHYVTVYLNVLGAIDDETKKSVKIMESSFSEIDWFYPWLLPEDTWDSVKTLINPRNFTQEELMNTLEREI